MGFVFIGENRKFMADIVWPIDLFKIHFSVGHVIYLLNSIVLCFCSVCYDKRREWYTVNSVPADLLRFQATYQRVNRVIWKWKLCFSDASRMNTKTKAKERKKFLDKIPLQSTVFFFIYMTRRHRKKAARFFTSDFYSINLFIGPNDVNEEKVTKEEFRRENLSHSECYANLISTLCESIPFSRWSNLDCIFVRRYKVNCLF